MKIFKIIFSIIFLLFTIIWILFTINYFGWVDAKWEFINNIPGVKALYEKIQAHINAGNTHIRNIAFKMILIGGAVFLGYMTIMFPIKRIPLIGPAIKFLTGIIPGISSVVIIIGLILMFINTSSNANFINTILYANNYLLI